MPVSKLNEGQLKLIIAELHIEKEYLFQLIEQKDKQIEAKQKEIEGLKQSLAQYEKKD